MSAGVRVLIDTNDGNSHTITEYGYITRRLNSQLYEIWGESSQVTYLLSPQEFTEIKEDQGGSHLYGMRDKIQ